MPLVNAVAKNFAGTLISADGLYHSAYPAGDFPVGGSPFSINFTTATIEDPLSAGGVFTNASQGTGGNFAVTDKSSLRVALASDGTTKIAQHRAAPIVSGAADDYADSFAFVPGISAAGNIRVIARLYRAPGYAPTANHELEIILGCKSTGSTNSKWIECLRQIDGSSGSDIVLLDGVASNFTLIGGNQVSFGGIVDGELFKAELDRSVNPHRVRWWIDQTGTGSSYVLGYDSNSGGAAKSLITNLGDGAGIAAFRRPGDTNSGGIGFRSFLVEAF